MDKFYNEDCITGMKAHVKSNTVDLIISDPPFGIDGHKIENLYNRDSSKVIGDYVEVSKEEYLSFSKDWLKQAERVLKPGGSIYIFSGYTNLKDILIALDETNLKFVNHIIWRYNFGIYTKRKYVSSHYHILYYYKTGGNRTFNTYSRFNANQLTKKGNKANYKDREDVWNINKEYHTNKLKTKNKLPEKLIQKIIDYSSNKGDIILDCFLGSFTTIKVARASKRKFVGFEISEEVFEFGVQSVISVA